MDSARNSTTQFLLRRLPRTTVYWSHLFMTIINIQLHKYIKELNDMEFLYKLVNDIRSSLLGELRFNISNKINRQTLKVFYSPIFKSNYTE